MNNTCLQTQRVVCIIVICEDEDKCWWIILEQETLLPGSDNLWSFQQQINNNNIADCEHLHDADIQHLIQHFCDSGDAETNTTFLRFCCWHVSQIICSLIQSEKFFIEDKSSLKKFSHIVTIAPATVSIAS